MPNTSSAIATEGATPILFAADRSDVPLMRLLIELGADPLLPNFNSTTPLMAAAGVGTREAQEEAGEESEAVEAVTMLLDHGADVNGVDNNGDTAMHGAASNLSPCRGICLPSAGRSEIWATPTSRAGRRCSSPKVTPASPASRSTDHRRCHQSHAGGGTFDRRRAAKGG